MIRTFSSARALDVRTIPILYQPIATRSIAEPATCNIAGCVSGQNLATPVIMAIGSSLAVMNTMYVATAYRTRGSATLRLLGFCRQGILGSFFVEPSHRRFRWRI